MGRKYIAWGTVQQDDAGVWHPHRHGMLYPPDIGETKSFGRQLGSWTHTFEWFFRHDLGAVLGVAERFTYRPGSQGQAAEDINLRLAPMQLLGPEFWLVRNVDWKQWFSKNVNPLGTEAHHGVTTPHEADALGLARYGAEALWPRILQENKTSEQVGIPLGTDHYRAAKPANKRKKK